MNTAEKIAATYLRLNEYAVEWILRRIDWVTKNLEGRTKERSWTWSEEFLANMLILKRYGKLESLRESEAK
jgi:hypothetical protein